VPRVRGAREDVEGIKERNVEEKPCETGVPDTSDICPHLLLHRIRPLASQLAIVCWLPRAASIGLRLSAIVRPTSSVVRWIFRLFWLRLREPARQRTLPCIRQPVRNDKLPVVGCEGIRPVDGSDVFAQHIIRWGLITSENERVLRKSGTEQIAADGVGVQYVDWLAGAPSS